MSNKLSRRQVREKAVQTIFQLIQPQEYTTKENALEFALDAGNDPEVGFDPQTQDDYLVELVNGVSDKAEQLDQKISSYLTNDWTLERIAKIDLALLRVAFYEIMYVSDEFVPNKVAVNEAIEMSKTFSDEKSRQFISGVLAHVLEENI